MPRLIVPVLLAFALIVGARAYGQPISYFAFMDGPSEAPPNASPGTGFAQLDIDTTAHTMRVRASFQDLIGTTTAAHVHTPTATPGVGTASVATQVPSFSGFPLGVTSGNMDTTFDTSQASTWNPSYITANGGTPLGAEAAFAQQLSEGRAYFNIHSTQFPGGEIRGFLAIPEPGSAALLGTAGILALAQRRRRRGA